MYASSTATNAAAADSGTTDAATEDKLTQSGQNFLTTVSVGDYAVITTAVSAAYPVRAWAEVTAADASKCVLSGAKFTQNVQGGDIVCNTTTNLNYTVASVTDDTTIVLSGTNFGILVGDDFFILSGRGSQGARKVRLDNATEIRGNASNGEVTVHYKKGAAANDKLAIDMGDTVTDDAYFIKFKEVALNVMKSQWTVNSATMPLTTSSGTQGIQWAATFTFS